MKKSQVLAALALAFALGLGAVAPTASTYATVLYPVGTTQEQIDANNLAINSEVNAALKAYGDLEKSLSIILFTYKLSAPLLVCVKPSVIM